MSPLKYLPFLLLWLIGSPLNAEIAIVQITVSPDGDANSCDGTIALNAYGSAGPFTVVFPATESGEEEVFTEVDGFLQVTDLCRGFHEIQVYPTRFPTCVTILEVDLVATPQKTDKNVSLFTEELAEGEMRVVVSPNPSDGRVTLDVSSGPLPDNSKVMSGWSINVLDANGKVVYEQSAAAKASVGPRTRQFGLNLENLIGGVYFVRVIRPDGVEGRARVILR